MADTIEPLIADLVAFVATEDRAYFDVMDAWRTSCPRLPVWEEANERGLITRAVGDNGTAMVRVTPKGMALLRTQTVPRPA